LTKPGENYDETKELYSLLSYSFYHKCLKESTTMEIWLL